MYWIVNDIGSSKGKIHKNQFHKLDTFSSGTIRKLLEKNVIREIHSPPIKKIPQLQEYATMLKKHGVISVMDILDNHDEIATMLNISEQKSEIVLAIAEMVLRPDTPLSGG